MAAKQPHVVSLNEICRNDLPQLAPAMGNGLSAFAPARRPDGTPVRCTNGDEYGNGLIFRSPAAGTVFSGQYATQDGGSEKRVYVCAEFADLVGCGTHLSTTGNVATAQCKAAIALLRDRAVAGRQTFLAGDFNLKYAPLIGPDVQDCNAAPFFRKGDGSVQHVFAANLGYVRTEVTGHDVHGPSRPARRAVPALRGIEADGMSGEGRTTVRRKPVPRDAPGHRGRTARWPRR
ncbi:endonuclease/exonuclease/phosphatase family protein [Nonomuraea angiospora]|uniref:endonuclease/exonuclease/phosphatase family protein n=1 Tax=Nonomuraea angiospora TaxID=46172 RepID=UPI003683542C